MSFEHLVAFNILLFAALVSPGPAMLISLRATTASGLRAGIFTGLGLAVMASIWTMAALFGLEGLFRLAPWAFGALKTAGGAYLIWIAVQTWRHAKQPLNSHSEMRKNAFFQGLLVNFGNPKSILFAAAVLLVVFPPDLTIAERLLIGANHLVVEIIAYSLLAALTVVTGLDRALRRAKRWFDRVTALVLGAFGVRLLLDQSTP